MKYAATILVFLLLGLQANAQAQIGLINIGNGRRPQQQPAPLAQQAPYQQTDPALIAVLQRQADQQAQLLAYLMSHSRLAPNPVPGIPPGAPQVYESRAPILNPVPPNISIQIGQVPQLQPVPPAPMLTPVPPAPILTPVPAPPNLTPVPPAPGLTPVPRAPGLTDSVWYPQRYAIYRR